MAERGYIEDFVTEQIETSSNFDRTLLIDEGGRCGNHKNDQILIIATFHSASCSLRDVAGRLQTILVASEEHMRVFHQNPSVVFRRAPNLKDNLVRAKLPRIKSEVAKVYFKCGKSHCYVCSFMYEGKSFSCNVSGNQNVISSSFNCDSSEVM